MLRGHLMEHSLCLWRWRDCGHVPKRLPAAFHHPKGLTPVTARSEGTHEQAVSRLTKRIELDELTRGCCRVLRSAALEVGRCEQLERAMGRFEEQTALPDDPRRLVAREKASPADLECDSCFRPGACELRLSRCQLSLVKRGASPLVVHEGSGGSLEPVLAGRMLNLKGRRLLRDRTQRCANPAREGTERIVPGIRKVIRPDRCGQFVSPDRP